MARPKSDSPLSAAERQRRWKARQAVTKTPAGNENPVTETQAGNENPGTEPLSVTETPSGAVTETANVVPIREGVEIVEAVPVSLRSPGFVSFRHQPHVPFALFDGQGRGVVRTHSDGKRYVMVARHQGPDIGELGIVTESDWRARLPQRCGHGLAGWQCHAC